MQHRTGIRSMISFSFDRCGQYAGVCQKHLPQLHSFISGAQIGQKGRSAVQLLRKARTHGARCWGHAQQPCRSPQRRSGVHCVRAQQQQQQQSAAVDFPPYTTVSRGPAYDLRFFDAYTVARMCYERRDEGYIGLGAYFDGANAAGAQLNESQPVVMRFQPQGSKSMELYVGSRRDGPLDSAPQPLDARLSLEAAGGEILAVLRFEGSATREATEAAVDRLRRALAADGLQLGDEEARGAFRLAQYGPLNSLSTRLNEVMLRVVL